MICSCDRLAKLIATNWSYFQCVDCGKDYFSSGRAEVVWRWYSCPKCKDRWMYQDRHSRDNEYNEIIYECGCGYSETIKKSKKRQKKYLRSIKRRK